MSDEQLVLFEHGGRMVDAWGNDHGKVPEGEVDHRALLGQASATGDLSGNASSTNFDEDNQEPAEEEPTDLDEMTGKQLKAELQRRQEAGRDIDSTGVTKVGELRELLRADDEAAAAEK